MSFPYLSDVFRAAFGVNLPLPIPMFGLLVGIAFFAGLNFANREVKRLLPDQPPDFMTNVGMIGFFGGIIGARLFHLLEHPAEFLDHPMKMLLSRGGFTIYGGLIIGLAAGLMYCRKKRAPLATMLDAVAPGIMLAYAVGRIGCQISGDGDWGIAADLAAKPAWLPLWLWAQTYDGNIAGVLIPPPGVYPTPIYETAMALIAFAVLWRLRLHRNRTGWLFGVYLLLVGVERLLIEPIRVNTTFELAGMAITQAQIISVLCVIGGIAVMIWRRRSAQPAPV
ncbi:MAG TPA: prolipoprotein diacylglyceryl transferase [Steroidobacteraceae bacterium]|nr:prolipoprotein diacylglyceryl transferase [Steroidobacteraceae bacterium]